MLPQRVRLSPSEVESNGTDTVALPPNPRKAKVLLAVILGFPDRLPAMAGESDFTQGKGLA